VRPSSLLIKQAGRWVISVEVWVVAALAAACALSDRLLLPAVLLAALFWPLRWLAYGRLTIRTPLDWPAAVLALLVPITLLATPLPDITLPQVYRLMIGLALSYAIANHAWGSGGLKMALAGLVGLGVALSLAALMSVDWFEDKFGIIPIQILKDLPHLLGEQVQPNVMAGTLALLALFGPAWLFFGARKFKWWACILLFLATACIFTVLALTKSRGGWLGLAAGLAVLVVLRWPRWGSVVVVVLCLAGGIFVAFQPRLVDELFYGTGGGLNLSSLQGREEIWGRAVLQIKEFPLTGFGMGTFPEVSRTLYPFFLQVAGDVPHAHNLFLQIAVDLGIPGLAIWLIMALVVVRCAWQVYRAGLRQAGWLAGLGAGLMAAQVTLATHGLVDAVTWDTRPALVVWGLWGLALAGWGFISREAKN
jgi:putative inorganic carbon (hco3(-)) transporter